MANQPGKKTWKDLLNSMNKNTIGIVLCAAVVVIVLAVFLIGKGVGGGESSQDKAETGDGAISQSEDYSQIGDSNLSGVTTDSKKDNKAWQEMKDEEYSLEITALEDGWTGDYMEDGSDDAVKEVMALKFTNVGTQDVQYAEYLFKIGKKTASFKLSDLPSGQSCIVLEANRNKFSEKDVLSLVSRVVVQVDAIPLAQDQVLVVDNSDNSITIMNMTEKEIPVVRAFYKTYDTKEKAFIGGITYTAKAENVPAGGGVTLTPTHFQSGKSMIVGTGVYEKES